MKTKGILIAGFLIALASCSQPVPKQQKPLANKVGSKETVSCTYTCTMHPEVCSNKPGICPKCGMDLVEKD